MQTSEITAITEGRTKILALRQSFDAKVPPQNVAFFNPRAKLSRDFSIIAYSAFLRGFDGPRLFLDSLAGVGARGLRVANEIENVQVVVNDLNPSSLELAKKSAELNGLVNLRVSEDEACRFLSGFSKMRCRGTIVDIDPFGSPARHIDCGIRATLHGGMLSVTATDLQVLHGLFNDACRKKYGGTPIKTTYSNEISIRLIIGMINSIAARLDTEITPLFVENNNHYYRVYLRMLNKPDTKSRTGYIIHCRSCGHRQTAPERVDECAACGSKTDVAGPLWISKIYEREFVSKMLSEIPSLEVDKKCEKGLAKSLLESDMPPCYYTLDEIAEMERSSPVPLAKILTMLQDAGYLSSPTAFNPTGFRTNAPISAIRKMFSQRP